MSKLLTSAGIAMLLLLMGMPTLVRAQEERAPRQEEPRAEPKHEQEAPNAEPKRQDEAKPSKQEKKEQKQEEKQSREMSQPNQNTHARPAGKGGHIPDDKFRANFGRSHTFVVQRTTVVNNQPGFIYGGYTFVFVDPWPAEWAYTDDCYVDYIDGEYFLFDVLHPGVQVALFVVM